MSLARKIKRGLCKIIFLKSLKKFVIYEKTKRGRWMIKGNDSAKPLDNYQINKLISVNNG